MKRSTRDRRRRSSPPSRARRVRVGLGRRSYSVHVEAGALGRAEIWNGGLVRAPRVAVITNRRVDRLYGRRLRSTLRGALGRSCRIETVLTPDGERYKTLETMASIYDRLLAGGSDRDLLVVAFGGGVVGDMAGFAAATVLRGVRLVQIPTTLLAQVDSSVGGKTGVNTKRGKNLVGAFYQPSLVIADPALLASLAARQYRAGLAEVVKYGVILSPGLFSLLEKRADEVLNRDASTMTDVVARCCRLKARVISRDETEAGHRRILNFGHTVGHAIESLTGYRRFLHGEAVAVGMVAAMRLSRELGTCSTADLDRVEALLARFGLPHSIEAAGVDPAALARAVGFDKKVAGGDVRFILAEGIGGCRERALGPRVIAGAVR